MNLADAIAALRPVQSHYSTPNGVHVGFFMRNATAALGGLAQASDTLAILMVQGLVESEPVVMDGEVQTIFRVADATPPTSRSVH